MTALLIVVKASVLFASGALVQALVGRRASAAARHLVWTWTLAAAALLPATSIVLPGWPLPVPAALERRIASEPARHATAGVVPSDAPSTPADAVPVVRTEASAVPAPAPPLPAPGWRTVAVGLYAAGVVALLVQFLMLQLALGRFARRGSPVDDPAWLALAAECARAVGVRRPVRLLRSRDQTMPLAFGTLRPTIVMPAVADTWDDATRRAVLLHELAHVARYDCLTERGAAAACALYWFHPAAWWIARRLRVERELACDDRVIAAGTEARDYAGQLLELAYALSRHRAPALAVAMGGRGQLEGRMRAALDAARNRRPPARSLRLAGAAVAVALLCAVAVVRPAARIHEAVVERPQASAAPDGARPRLVERRLHPGSIVDVARDVVRRTVHSVRSAVGFAQGVPGTWEIRAGRDKGTVQLRIVEINSSNSSTMPIERLEGLTEALLTGSGGPVQFRLRRDAGTFTFDGIIRNGVGAGTFGFAADAGFAAALEKRGYGRPTQAEQYQLARHDIGLAFVDDLAAQGYARVQTADLVRAGQHGVRADYLREMGQLGYRQRSLDDLIELRDHGVTPAYVRELAALGYASIATDDVLRARDHGVTPDYVRGMRDAGYTSLSLEALVEARDHGVTPEFVRGLADAGHRQLSIEKAIEVRDHGVTPEYVRELGQLGLSANIDDLVNARDHGVSVEFAREMSAGFGKLPLDALVKLRDHGVTPDYARGLKSLGYDRLQPADLIMLRDHGLAVERIRSLNQRAGTRLPVDLLTSFNGR